jgi:hypothetical protein
MLTIERFRTQLQIEKYQPVKPQKQLAKEEIERIRYIGILKEDSERYTTILNECMERYISILEENGESL